MYLNFYGLKEKPFQILPDPRYFFLSSKHKSALSYLEYGLLNNVGFIVITGEIGTGKTTLIKKFLSSLAKGTITAVISNTNLEPKEFLQMLLQELGIDYSKDETKANLLNKLYYFLIERYAQRQRVILIVDEAQNLPLSVLEEIRMISNLQTEKDFLIQIILVGQPPLKNKLLQPSLEQLLQRVSLSYHLSPLSEDETEKYIKYRLNLAGARDNIFSKEAIQAIFKYSQGVPRVINTLCEAALVYGFVSETPSIDVKIIEDVVEDLYPYRLGQLEKKGSLSPTKTQLMEEEKLSYLLNEIKKRLVSLENAIYNFRQTELFLLYKIILLLEIIKGGENISIELQKIHKECQETIDRELQKLSQWKTKIEKELT